MNNSNLNENNQLNDNIPVQYNNAVPTQQPIPQQETNTQQTNVNTNQNNNKKENTKKALTLIIIVVVIFILIFILIFSKLIFSLNYCGTVNNSKLRSRDEIKEYAKKKLKELTDLDVDVEITNKKRLYYFKELYGGCYIKNAYLYSLNCKTKNNISFKLYYHDPHTSYFGFKKKVIDGFSDSELFEFNKNIDKIKGSEQILDYTQETATQKNIDIKTSGNLKEEQYNIEINKYNKIEDIEIYYNDYINSIRKTIRKYNYAKNFKAHFITTLYSLNNTEDTVYDRSEKNIIYNNKLNTYDKEINKYLNPTDGNKYRIIIKTDIDYYSDVSSEVYIRKAIK